MGESSIIRRMGKHVATRSGLLDRWRVIEAEDDDEDVDHHFHHHGGGGGKRRRLHLLKEAWFADAFNFLTALPKDNHIWCGYREVMGPLLETFYNYYRDDSHDSALKILWGRLSHEMQRCTQCILHHHQTQQTYSTDYEPSSIGPLLQVLRTLDEERICNNLKEINAKIFRGEYAPASENAAVVGIMFEVLMFPFLLDDQLLATEFEIFIEAINNSHELTLEGHQQYPGVYALLFLKSRRARSIGYRLAGQTGKLRRSEDLDPLQPLLKKYIVFLETEIIPSTAMTIRPRVQLDRITVWLGIKALLGFLEPPAFEEGILDQYPVFLSIVLNHISDDSPEFSYAVNCLKLLFEMLGCKLWLRSTLSPSVICNSLLGQCFHTRNEKIHKEIFDLFRPFLQSLEALQDGEHEEQRRHILYFLLHQVTVSSNFSTLMRKKACQIALLIVHRGYKMNPPSPPYKCAHMWAPSLVSSLKDLSLHISLRQPAFDLIETVIVSDASALVGSILNSCLPSNNEVVLHSMFNDEHNDDEELFLGDNIDEKDKSCWNEFNFQSKITSLVSEEWLCIPMLWFDVLVGIDPLILPISFSKAVFWSLSRFSMVEAENGIKTVVSVEDLLATCASEISHVFGWKVPSGSDDGGHGKVCENSVNVSKLHKPLIRTFRRLASHYVVLVEQGELRKKWTWESMMADSLILLLVDPNDNDRQVSRHIIEQFSGEKGLTCGLQFLCSSQPSLEAVFRGLRHALNLVLLDSVLLNFETLHHFFFVLCKLIKEGNLSTRLIDGNSPGTLSSRGGFLRQPDFDSRVQDLFMPVISSKMWENFCYLISEMAWPSLLKCLAKGKAFKHNKISQMTCIRLLEILPVIFGKLCGNSAVMMRIINDMMWLQDLMNWGRSSLAVVARYWKQTLASLLGLLKKSCNDISASAFSDLEELLSSGGATMDEINDQVARLSVSLRDEGCFSDNVSKLKFQALFSEEVLQGKNFSVVSVEPFSSKLVDEDKSNSIILLDDDGEQSTSANDKIQSQLGMHRLSFDDQVLSPKSTGKVLGSNKENDVRSCLFTNLLETTCEGSSDGVSDPIEQKRESNIIYGKQQSPPLIRSKSVASKEKQYSECSRNDSSLKQRTSELKSGEIAISGSISQHAFEPKTSFDRTKVQKSIGKVPDSINMACNEVVCDQKDESWEFAFFKSARPQKSLFTKPSQLGTKRQVIQLNIPMENRCWRVNSEMRRFKVPRLDVWYKPILELDYFVTVGLASADKDRDRMACKLKEVPVVFRSPDEYVEVFRPLVLEEFKSQLHNSFQEMTSVEVMNYRVLSVLSVERIDDFHIVRCVHEDIDFVGSRSFLENDLILLTRQPLQCSRHDVHMVGKVERRETDAKRKSSILVIRLYLKNGCPRLNRARKSLVERSKWCISRLMSITPQLREFQALSSLREIPLLPVILDPSTCPPRFYNSRSENLNKMPQPLQQILKSSYNGSQMQAISAATGSFDLEKDFELTLIQGPPGTGKTRTILAIVSGLLALFQSMNKKRNSGSHDPYCNTISVTRSRSQINESAAIARAWQDAALAKQLHEDERRDIKSTGSHVRGRVLICAHSNAAVDELVSRISTEGLYGCDGLMYKPYLVRVGNVKTVHPNSLPVFIDTLVDHRLAEERVKAQKDETSVDSVLVLRSNLESIIDRIRFYEARRANLGNGDLETMRLLEGNMQGDEIESTDTDIEAKLRYLYTKRKAIYKDLSDAQAQERKAKEECNALKHKLRRAILKEAEIIVTTLSGCGGDLYGVCAESMSNHKFSSSSESALFDAVVVDEAAQALEPATLIPLQLLKSKETRCVMVGDPKQLPATVISNIASKYLFQCSMFERLQRAGHPVFMLTQQYRMHPEICRFPALHFYDGKLRNGDLMSSKAMVFHETECFGPYLFFDVTDGQESHGKNAGSLSLYNECEADAAVELVRFFKTRYPLEYVGGRIGVVTPYKSQLSVLRSKFSTAFGSSILDEIEFNTIDGFQGREVDILVLSTVRAAESCSQSTVLNTSSIGFVADVRRMNVALTRAKFSLWILGNARTLQTNENWASLLRDARERNFVRVVRKPYKCIFKSASNKISVVESPGNDLRKPKPIENVKTVGKRVDLENRTSTSEEKRKYIISEAPVDDFTSNIGYDVLATDNAVKCSKRRVMNRRDAESMKDFASVVVQNNEKQKSLRLRYPVRERQVSNHGPTRQISCERKIKRWALDAGNGKKTGNSSNDSICLKKKCGNCELSKFGTSERCLGPCELEIRQPVLNSGVVSSEGGLRVTGGRDLEETSGPVESFKDTIAKRKLQRDAIDALLSSALVSSKKGESSVKSLPVRRLSSASVRNEAIRPPKLRKGS